MPSVDDGAGMPYSTSTPHKDMRRKVSVTLAVGHVDRKKEKAPWSFSWWLPAEKKTHATRMAHLG